MPCSCSSQNFASSSIAAFCFIVWLPAARSLQPVIEFLFVGGFLTSWIVIPVSHLQLCCIHPTIFGLKIRKHVFLRVLPRIGFSEWTLPEAVRAAQRTDRSE